MVGDVFVKLGYTFVDPYFNIELQFMSFLMIMREVICNSSLKSD